MALLNRWNDLRWGELDQPFSALEEMQRQLDRIYGDYVRGAGDPRALGGAPARAAANWPRANLYDAGEELVLVAECPGLSEGDVNLQLHQDALTIAGERREEAPEGYSVHRRERGSIAFSRTFQMPYKVDPDRCEASLKNGLLTVRVGKAAEAKPRQISVKAS